MEASYRHTQIGTLTLAILFGSLAVIAVIGIQTGWNAVLVIVAAVLLVCGIVFSSLTVEIRDGVLDCRFSTGLIRKRFALQDIVDARAVRNRWYYGWGIRWTPRGWLWNVSGLDAIELSFASGRAFRIGTDRPEELAAALKRAIT
ncbi:MAG: hypothetical protein GY719_36665 [bacterium]|nr:hypothetical protein [bacterium]